MIIGSRYKAEVTLESTSWTTLQQILCQNVNGNPRIHLFIQKFVKRPFKISTQSSPATAIQISPMQPVEHTFIILRQEANFQGESIPSRGTNNGECSALPGCSSSTKQHELARNSGTKGSSTRYTRCRTTGLVEVCVHSSCEAHILL